MNMHPSSSESSPEPSIPAEGNSAEEASIVSADTAPMVPYSRRDLRPRQRDAQGAPIPGSFVFAPVLADPQNLEETDLVPMIAVIDERRPDLAHLLRDIVRRRVVPAVLEIDRVRAEEAHLLPERIRESEEHNGRIEAALTTLRREWDGAIEAHRGKLEQMREMLNRAHGAASRAFSAAGGTYDPQHPVDESLPHPQPRSTRAVADELHLPWPLRTEVFRLPKWLHWVLTAIVGLLIGVNLGLATHILEQDTLFRHPLLTLAAWAVGAALAKVVWLTVTALWFNVGLYFYLGRPLVRFWAALSAALLLTALLLGADVSTLRQGLLTSAQVNSSVSQLSDRGGEAAEAGNDASGAFWLVSLVATLGFMAFAAVQGVAEGRHDAVENKILRHQEADLRDRQAAFRRRPEVQTARRTLADVREAQRQHAVADAELASASAPFEARQAALATQRLPDRAALKERSECRIQDAVHDAMGAQQELDQQQEQALAACHEPASGRRAATSGRPW